MSFIGIEEIFLQVEDMQKALDFYQGVLGIPVDKQDAERTYLQTEQGHVVLQIRNHTGRHRGGGPLHFAFTVSEETFDEVLGRLDGRHLVHARPLRGTRRGAGALHDRPRRERDRGQHPLPVRQAEALSRAGTASGTFASTSGGPFGEVFRCLLHARSSSRTARLRCQGLEASGIHPSPRVRAGGRGMASAKQSCLRASEPR